MSIVTRGPGRRIVAAVVLGTVALSACGSDGEPPLGSIERPGITAPPDGTTAPEPAPTTPPAPEPEPEPEQPPAEEAPPEESVPAEQPPAEGEPLTTEQWIAVILIGLLALGAIAGIVMFLTRRHDDPADVSTQRRLDDIVRSSRSIHDSTAITLLQTDDPVTLQNGWGVAQQQFVDLRGRLAAVSGEVADPTSQQVLQQLGSALAGLEGALGSYVGVRLDPGSASQAELIQQSQQTALGRNQQLDAAINQALYIRL